MKKLIALLTAMMMLISACGGGGGNQAQTSGAADSSPSSTASGTATSTASSSPSETASEPSKASATEAAATEAAATEAAATEASTTKEAATVASTASTEKEPVGRDGTVATIRTFVQWGGTYEPGSLQQEVYGEISKRIYEQSGFKVDFKIYSTDYADASSKLTLLIATNELDAIYYDYTTMKDYVKSDDVPYSFSMDTLEKYGPHVLGHLNKPLVDEYLTAADGGIKAFTYKVTTPGAINSMLPWIRKDLLDQAGLEVPRTLSELEAAFKAFREINPDMVMLDCMYGDYMFFSGTLQGMAVPAKQTDENGDLLPSLHNYYFKTPEFKEYLSTVARFFKEGYISNEYYIWDNDRKEENFTAGNTAVWVDGWWIQSWIDKLADLTPENPRAEGVPYMNCVPMNPTTDDGRPMYLSVFPAPSGISYVHVVFKNAKCPEACLAAIDWGVTSADNYVLARFGIEGRQYEMKDGGLRTIKENQGSYVSVLAEFLPSPDATKTIEMQYKGVRSDFMMAYDHENTKFVHMLETDVTFDWEALGTLPEDLDSLFNQRFVSVIVGELPVESWDQVIDELDAAGFQKYMDEKNRQYREHVRSQK